MLKKTLAAVIAALTAIVPVSLNGMTFFDTSVAYAEDQSTEQSQMAWIPNDFESAQEFRNTYGATHIEDGYVCIVYQMEYEPTDPEVFIHFLRYQFRNEGDALCVESSEFYTYSDDPVIGEPGYCVILFSINHSGNYEVDMIDESLQTSPDSEYLHSLGHYSFSVDQYGNITETDIYNWLPDCETEYKDYIEKYGKISVRDNFVVFCMDSNAGVPLRWQEISRNYYDNFILKTSLFCNAETTEPVDGGELHRIAVYQAVKDGYAKIEWEYSPNYIWELDPPFSEDDLKDPLTADCVILDDAQTVLLNDQTRVTVTDKETGELMSDKYLESYPFKFHADIIYKSEQFSSLSGDANYTVTKNKSILQECYLSPSLSSLAIAYKKADHFEITTEEPPEIIYYDNGAMDLTFKTSKPPLGDLNGDKIFSISDLVLLQRWLLGTSDVKIIDWSLADFNEDNKVDVFDLCLMRKTLIKSIDIPVAISITETGGYEGVHKVWKVYQENDSYFVYYKNEKRNTDPSVIEITERVYRELMSQDYDRMIETYNTSQHEEIWDGFYYKTVLTYEDDSEKKTSADMFNIIYKIEKTLNTIFD